METGSKPIFPSTLFKKNISLRPDLESEGRDNSKVYVQFGRDRIELLKVGSTLKAIAYEDYSVPFSSSDFVWIERIDNFLKSDTYVAFVKDQLVEYLIQDVLFSIVPKPLYDEGRSRQILEFSHDIQAGTTVETIDLEYIDAMCIYALPEKLPIVLGAKPSLSFVHWLKSAITTSKETIANIHVKEKGFALVLSKGSKLLFCNWFYYNKPADITYFLMATLESLNILHSEVSVVLSGAIEKKDDLFTLVEKYISKVTLAEHPQNLQYAYSFKQLPKQQAHFILSAACA